MGLKRWGKLHWLVQHLRFLLENYCGGKAKAGADEADAHFIKADGWAQLWKAVAHAPHTQTMLAGKREGIPTNMHEDLKRREYLPGNYYVISILEQSRWATTVNWEYRWLLIR